MYYDVKVIYKLSKIVMDWYDSKGVYVLFVSDDKNTIVEFIYNENKSVFYRCKNNEEEILRKMIDTLNM